jgi:hypothetical protein
MSPTINTAGKFCMCRTAQTLPSERYFLNGEYPLHCGEAFGSNGREEKPLAAAMTRQTVRQAPWQNSPPLCPN